MLYFTYPVSHKALRLFHNWVATVIDHILQFSHTNQWLTNMTAIEKWLTWSGTYTANQYHNKNDSVWRSAGETERESAIFEAILVASRNLIIYHISNKGLNQGSYNIYGQLGWVQLQGKCRSSPWFLSWFYVVFPVISWPNCDIRIPLNLLWKSSCLLQVLSFYTVQFTESWVVY